MIGSFPNMYVHGQPFHMAVGWVILFPVNQTCRPTSWTQSSPLPTSTQGGPTEEGAQRGPESAQSLHPTSHPARVPGVSMPAPRLFHSGGCCVLLFKEFLFLIPGSLLSVYVKAKPKIGVTTFRRQGFRRRLRSHLTRPRTKSFPDGDNTNLAPPCHWTNKAS